jgi:hypothetical protein
MMEYQKFRKKPVVIEAMRWEGDNDSWDDIESFTKCAARLNYEKCGEIFINTLEGTMTACVGDWIIKGVKGEFYPCKPDIFEATYEKVE